MGELLGGYKPVGRHAVRHGDEDTIKWLHWSKSGLLETKGFVPNNWAKYKEMDERGDVVEGILFGKRCYIDIKELEAWYESI